MTTENTKIACIGAGYWGKNLIRNFHSLGALEWICEAEPDRCSYFASQYPDVTVNGSLENILSEPRISGIVIATPAETHGELVRRALIAGKDVFVEKPLSLSVAEGAKLVALAEAEQRILMVGHLLWYHPAILRLKELIDEGELGRLQYIYSNRLNLGKIRREENILWSFAPHDISVILGLVGETPSAVEASGGNYLHEQISDVTITLLTFPSGVKAHVFVSWLHPFKEQKLVIVGDRKMAVFDDVQTENKLLLYPHDITWKNNIPTPNRAAAQPVPYEDIEPLRSECLHFLDCIQSRQIPRTDGREGLRVLTTLQRCQEDLNTHVPPPITSLKPQPAYFAHESAFIDDKVEIGAGTTIWHVSHLLTDSRVGENCRIGQNVVIGPNVTIGDRTKIQNNVSVYEGVTLEDDVFCGPSMVFTNVHNPRSEIQRMEELRPTLVKKGATLGANSTIICGVTIGQYAFVGAGAVVTQDVPDFALVVGNPGKIIGWMCQCGNRITFGRKNGDGNCQDCGHTYHKNGQEVIRLC